MEASAEHFIEKKMENSLFHYTNAAGLVGILEEKSIWATANYCTNDLTENTYIEQLIKNLFYKGLSSKFPYELIGEIVGASEKVSSKFIKER